MFPGAYKEDVSGKSGCWSKEGNKGSLREAGNKQATIQRHHEKSG